MAKIYSCILSCAILSFFVCTVQGQSIRGDHQLGRCLNPSNEKSHKNADEITWEEDQNARTFTSSTYYSKDGQIKIRNSSRPINYIGKSGNLEPIESKLLSTGTDRYEALNQPFPTYLNMDGSMSLTLENKTDILTLGKNCKINGTPIHNFFHFTGNNTTIFNVIDGVDKELIFRENGVKYNYILENQISGNQTSSVFSEEILLPKGYKIVRDKSRGKKTEEGWSGNLVVLNTEGNVVSTFHEPLCIDASNKYIIASYNVIETNGTFTIEIVVPSSWLNDSERVYPVVIDPIVTGPTAAWAGGQMPSCFIPSYNQDSIQVTIPAGVTVTELNITASFYADPFTSAWMQDGSMYFSTDCGQSQTFTITGVAGQSAGTAYLDYYNIYNPLTCCFPESCSAQSFWLSFHIGRSLWGAGCNTTYIRYDPVTTSWPYEAVVVGKTPESFSGQWSVSPLAKCANDCSIIGTGYVYYGVPPYTFTHPWSNDTVVQGVNNGCATGANNHMFDLTIPNCPIQCDTINDTLAIPPPTIIDACGNVVQGLPTKYVPLKPVPGLIPIYDTLICSGDFIDIDLAPCLPGSNVIWDGNGNSGNANISETLYTGTSISIVNYLASADLNGCFSDTINIPVYIQPTPIPGYTTAPDPIISGLPTTFTDASIFNTSPGVLWIYDFGDGTSDASQNTTHTYPIPGIYEICLYVENAVGCADSICEMVNVAPAEVVAPNVVTSNNDGINDLFSFRYLEFYPENELSVINRWGNVVYKTKNYTNDWNPRNLSEGTYFYKLTISNTDKEYQGFFQLVK